MGFHKIPSKQWQTLRLSQPVGVDNKTSNKSTLNTLILPSLNT